MAATTPATWGHDIEVPDMMLKEGGSFPCRVMSPVVSLAIHAARMFTPGAAMSGCRISDIHPGQFFVRLNYFPGWRNCKQRHHLEKVWRAV